jgi:hypothetical protein
MFTPIQSFQGFVYGSEQVAYNKDSYTKENYLSTIQNLGNSRIEIADTLKKSGYSWTNSESTLLPIFSIGVNNQAEQKTGEYAYLMMGSSDKNTMYSVTTFRLTNGDLLTKIETALTGSDLFTVQLVKVGNNGYQVNSPLAPQGQYIPLDTSLDAINFVVASIWVGAMSVIGKYQKEKSRSIEQLVNSKSYVESIKKENSGILVEKEVIRKERGEKPSGGDGTRNERGEIQGDEVMCTPHDMGCSALSTPDGKLNFWFPCAGSFSSDIFDCCYRHDVGIYCATSIVDAIAEDLDLVHCISAKIIAAGIEEMSWTCRWLFAPLLITFINSLSILGYIFMPFWLYKSELTNYDGSHSKSCLCGGNIPTVCCDSEKVRSICLDKNCNKVNLCIAKGERISNPQCNPSVNKKCYNCSWKCRYDDNGDYVGKEYVTDPTRKLPCCGSIQPKGGLKCPV